MGSFRSNKRDDWKRETGDDSWKTNDTECKSPERPKASEYHSEENDEGRARLHNKFLVLLTVSTESFENVKYFITRMGSNPRYKLGRISFLFFFFVMVVANCNESCYWLHVHCSQWQLLLFFPFGIKIAIVAIWRVSCGELVYWLARCTNPELVAKCEHILCMTSCELNEQAAKPKFVAQSWPSFC